MKKFWKCAFIRAVRTIAQTALGVMGASKFLSEIDWKMMLSASILAGLFSILNSIVTGLPEAEEIEVL